MLGLILGFAAVFFVLLTGVYYHYNPRKSALSVFKKVVAFSFIMLIAAFVLVPSTALAQTAGETPKEVNGNAMIGVALSTGLAALGAGIAVGLTGSAAIGAISEDPKMLGRSLIFVGLAEGIAIYGLVISIMIFGRV